jgi:hypothetical protein
MTETRECFSPQYPDPQGRQAYRLGALSFRRSFMFAQQAFGLVEMGKSFRLLPPNFTTVLTNPARIVNVIPQYRY